MSYGWIPKDAVVVNLDEAPTGAFIHPVTGQVCARIGNVFVVATDAGITQEKFAEILLKVADEVQAQRDVDVAESHRRATGRVLDLTG